MTNDLTIKEMTMHFSSIFGAVFLMVALLTSFNLTANQAPPGYEPDDTKTQINESIINSRDNAFLNSLGGVQIKEKKQGKLSARGLNLGSSEEKFFVYVNKKFEIKADADKRSKKYITTVQPPDKVELLYYLDDHGGTQNSDQLQWAKIRTQKGQEGFIPSAYIQRFKPNVKYYRRDIYVKEPKKYFVNTHSLNMRDAPTLSGYPLGSLTMNEEVLVTRYSDNQDYVDGNYARWAYVQTQGSYGYAQEGWVFSSYLSENKIIPGQQGPQDDPNHILSGSSKYVKARLLHIRDEPSKNGIIIGTTKHGNQVSILERKKAMISIAGMRSIWVKIQSDNTTGWVFGAFLSTNANSYVANDYIDKPFQNPLGDGNGRVTSPFGRRLHPVSKRPSMHIGIDLAAYQGHPIYAVGDGKIYTLRNTGRLGYGKYIVIQHDNELYTLYGHQLKHNVRSGQRVKAGDIIGYVGNTGTSTGPHLHFEVRSSPNSSTALDPANFFVIP